MKTRGKNRRPSLRLIIILVAVAVLLAAAGLIIFLLSRGTTGAAVELPFTESYNYCYTGNGFLYMEGSTLHYYDIADTDASYSMPIGSMDVSLAGCGSTHVAYTDTTVTVVGASFPIEFSGEVLNVACSNSFIAVHKRENNVDTLRIFNNKGEQVDELTFGKNTLTDFDFVKDGKGYQLYSVAVNTEASAPISTITTYNLNPQSVSCIITVQNQLLERVVFTPSSIFAVGTSNIIRYTRDGAYESYRLLCYGNECIDSSIFDSSQKPITFVMRKNGADKLDMVKIYRTTQTDVADEYITPLQLPDGCVYAFTSNGYVYALTNQALYKYSTKGVLVSTEALAYSPTSACKLSDTQLLVVAGGRQYLQKIKP